MAIDGRLAGEIVLADTLRAGTGALLAQSQATGDSSASCSRPATGARWPKRSRPGLPFSAVRSELTPDQKVMVVLSERKNGPVMMVGDGVNDAPALAAADIGVAMGARGAAASAEAADVVLLVDQLDRIVPAIEIASRSRFIALQSVYAGIGLSLAGMLAAALGYISPVQGALASGSDRRCGHSQRAESAQELGPHSLDRSASRIVRSDCGEYTRTRERSWRRDRWRSSAQARAKARSAATSCDNLREAGFAGPLHLVNPRYAEIDGVACVPRIEDLGDALTSSSSPHPRPPYPASLRLPAPEALRQRSSSRPGSAMARARSPMSPRRKRAQHGLRLVGPNCLGVLVPRRQAQRELRGAQRRARRSRADLAVGRHRGRAGRMGGAARSVGFSGVVSLGDQVDVDFGDCLDYFALDRATRAILLYIEVDQRRAQVHVGGPRRGPRCKPVVVIKSGRHAQGAKAAATHTGALAGSDAVYDAAFRRAGLLRVFDLDEIVRRRRNARARSKPFPGKRLAILTNGGGIGVLAVDRLIDLGGALAGHLARHPDEA